MTSEQLVHGDEDDPYKSKGHIELKIEILTEFIQEEIRSVRLSDPIYLHGVPWKICAVLHEYGQPAQNEKTPKYLRFCLEYNGSTDPSCHYKAIAKLKILAQKKGNVDHVYDVGHIFNFHGIEAGWRSLGSMTVGDLMNPDKGWYDEQSDSIVLAMDLTVDLADDGRAGEYVLVGQNELTLDKVPTSISLHIGNLQWQINFDFNDQNKKEEKSLLLSCKDVEAKSRGVDKVMLELFGYHRDEPKSVAYSAISKKSAVQRHLFTRNDNSLTVKIPGGSAFNNFLFNVRVLKDRSQFPDFTKPTAIVGLFPADVKLRLGDQQFHVNKQLLSSHSPFFDRNFNGFFDAARQQEVELSLEMHSPELFHDFLRVVCVNEALPNSMNVAALFKLADFYDAENVRQKCDQHLRMAREMPIEKRVLLARDHGSKETQELILDSVNFEQAKAINRLFMQKR